jgi:hypothetical protein
MVSSGTALDAELLLWLPQDLGHWAVFLAAFHHAERAPRGDQQPDGRVAHNQEALNILGADTRILANRVPRARKTRKCGTLVPENVVV